MSATEIHDPKRSTTEAEDVSNFPGLSRLGHTFELLRLRLAHVLDAKHKRDRRVLVAGLALVPWALSACGRERGKLPKSTPTPTKTPTAEPTPPPTPVPTATTMAPERAQELFKTTRDFANIRMHLDQDQVPHGYELLDLSTGLPSSDLIQLTGPERQHFVDAKRLQEESGSDQVVSFYFDDPRTTESLWDIQKVRAETPENPWILDAPEDLASPEELAAYGITITHGEAPNIPHLHIRKGAFERGKILEALSILNAPEFGFPSTKLMIHVVNSMVLWFSHLSLGQQQQIPGDYAQRLLNREREDRQRIENMRTDLISGYAQAIEFERGMIQKSTDLADIESRRKRIRLHLLRQKFNASLSSEELLVRMSADRLLDQHLPTTVSGEFTQKNGSESIILIAAGDAGLQAKERTVFVYGDDGQLVGHTFNTLKYHREEPYYNETLPNISASYPKVWRFPFNSGARYENGQYLFGAVHATQALRHELIHAWLLQWGNTLNSRGLLNRSWFLSQLVGREMLGVQVTELKIGDSNEFLTDFLAGLTIQQAEERLKEGGDDSLYHLVY